MKSLSKMCARHTLVPQSLNIELGDDSTGTLMYRGGFGDVWRRKYQGREVAVKVLRVYATNDLGLIARVSRQRSSSSSALPSNANRKLRRGSARNSYRGSFFGTQTCCL